MNILGYTIYDIFRVRKNVLDILKTQDYDVDPYYNFSIDEINLMNINNQLDMLLKNNKSNNKIYVRFNLNKIKLNEIVEDLYSESIDDNNNVCCPTLNKINDSLFIISNEKMNDSCKATLKQYWEQNGIFISYVPFNNLFYNALKHELVPPHKIIRDKTVIDDICHKYNIKNLSEFPNIDRFDPIAMLICMKPGEICHILRPSKTSLESDYYRLCV
uniref:RNA polymerase subunit H/Rpb5 C-terminal domain-containing protein n=1 Tax=viral metagenome TaxID=1070528 RepID=A0A6C0H645_9ZZZZ